MTYMERKLLLAMAKLLGRTVLAIIQGAPHQLMLQEAVDLRRDMNEYIMGVKAEQKMQRAVVDQALHPREKCTCGNESVCSWCTSSEEE